ncbi:MULTISPECIES: VOC family protein [Micromonospora]|uniref:VOC domain-containing protein n=1 Tax=Micromonospora yangpuensis TaxID=683228 RepID=A0A1C6VGT2_9ACTN|nr:VOC family protein [Micromonospora yangpuensis]GGL99250.1 glyoxalase [Micromonospora yangpuensis]SCL65539.1 hypothetical protein GA0070617_5795 [Micromonospora yangpuensis]
MPAVIRHVTIDCREPYALAQFWSVVTGFPLDTEDEPGDDECAVVPPDGGSPVLLFVQVPEAKAGKNRVHLDIAPRSGTRDEEVERLLGAGASLVDDRRKPDGKGWVVLADPEGNEFCVERGEAERANDKPSGT